jgi:hypothetical protein
MKSLAMVLCLLGSARSAFPAQGDELERMALAALAEPGTEARAALRARGPEALAVLARVRGGFVAGGAAAGREARFTEIFDAVAGQRDAEVSGLYWFEDLAAAQAAARKSGKPILSLRLLGRLTDERSCANSRFFRTALYPHAEIKQLLAERFVLHWKSERPVPLVTVDMGDGRRIETTVTGNSIHYVLDPDGHVLDALPGMYGPGTFLRRLQDAEFACRTVLGREPAQREAARRAVRAQALATLQAANQRELNAAVLPLVGIPPARPVVVRMPPTALAAGRRAESKLKVERPVLRSLLPEGDAEESWLQDPAWVEVAATRLAECRLDAAGRAAFERKVGDAASPGARVSMAAAFEDSMARDTVRGEHSLRPAILGWLVAEPQLGGNLEALNARVYADLFLTPASDPWLGLGGDGAYNALPRLGRHEAPRPQGR